MKAKIYSNIAGNLIVKRAPPTLRDQIVLRKFEKDEGVFTLIVFPTQSKKTIFSGAVNHVLSKVSVTERLVVFGGCFTLESLVLLRERGAEIFAVSDFQWTDEGFTVIREASASPVKFPPNKPNT
jgi:hypothetical protein